MLLFLMNSGLEALMKLLLDTHAFLWLRSKPHKVPATVLTAYGNPENRIYLSLVSIWEMQIKHQIGKLHLDLSLEELIQRQCDENMLEILPITMSHIFRLEHLPAHHKDPFDRLLIAQAHEEKLSLVSADSMMNQYKVNLFWQ